MKPVLVDSSKTMRAMIVGFILLLLIVVTVWVFVMVTANLASIFEAVGKGYDSSSKWWFPVLPQMNTGIR